MQSMTGHGSSRGRVGRSLFRVEIRSVNHRYCETSVRLPGRLALLEQELIQLVRKRFSRGKFDLFIKQEIVERESGEMETARRCYQMLRRIQKELHLEGKIGLSEILAFRNFLVPSNAEAEDSGAVRSGLLKILQQALSQLERMRKKEGEAMKRWFSKRIDRFKQLLHRLEKESLLGQKKNRERIESRLQESGTLQEGRVTEEAALWAHRSDVTEEVVRLKSHLEQFQKGFQAREAVGRKLDFLAQEMMREINTLGSKIDGVAAVHQVIDFKTELEKMREQIQNVE